jgi:hypothetical protein
MLFLRPEEESIAQFGHLLNDSMWIDPATGKLPKFIANSFGNFWFSFEMIGIGIIAICSYSIAIYFGIKIYKKLQSMKHLMSERTRRLQRSMTVILVIKGKIDFKLRFKSNFLKELLHFCSARFLCWLS